MNILLTFSNCLLPEVHSKNLILVQTLFIINGLGEGGCVSAPRVCGDQGHGTRYAHACESTTCVCVMHVHAGSMGGQGAWHAGSRACGDYGACREQGCAGSRACATKGLHVGTHKN